MSNDVLLCIKDLHVATGDKCLINNLSFCAKRGEIHALMGPNGSGKSSLAYAIAGHPSYKITSGRIVLDGADITGKPPEERSRSGLFLSFQDPPEVGGISLGTFVKMIASEKSLHADELRATLDKVKLDDKFLLRFLNEGFSGGEKKKSELLQLVARKPKFAILDEIDSGLDLDALKGAATILQRVAKMGTGLLLISHTPRLFELIRPTHVHILLNGKIAASGGMEFIARLVEGGYDAIASPV